MMIPGLDDVSRALALHAFRQQVLANDLANAQTPGFVAQDVVAAPFADVLGQTLALAETDPRHLAGGGDDATSAAGTLVSAPVLAGTAGTGVDPDAAMAEIAANALAYEAIATATGAEIALAKTALS